MKVRLPYYGTSVNRQTIPNNQMDVIIHDNKKGTCILIDAAIPKDRNVIKKAAEKILKYIKLLTEIHCMWNVRAKVKLVIKGQLGPFQKPSDNIWATYQESTKLRNHKKQPYWALHTQGANVKVQNIFHRWHYITCSTNCKYMTAATLCTLEMWFFQLCKCKYPDDDDDNGDCCCCC